MSEARCKVFFRSGSVTLEVAAARLIAAKLLVTRAENELSVRCGDGPILRIRYSDQASVAAEVRAIGAKSRHADALSRCNACFEVAFDDLAAVLDEVNTLLEVQMTLQEATRGFLFTEWNKALTGS